MAIRLAMGVNSEHENMITPVEAVCCMMVTSSILDGSPEGDTEDEEEFEEENMSPLPETLTCESDPIFPNWRYCRGSSLMFTMR